LDTTSVYNCQMRFFWSGKLLLCHRQGEDPPKGDSGYLGRARSACIGKLWML
jgi:hypothetical protein